MLYFWITNASRAHRAGRNDDSGKSTPINCSGKGNFYRKRKKELSVSPATSCSETQLDKISQKSIPTGSFNGSNSQMTTPNGSVDVPWIKSRSGGSSSGSSNHNQSTTFPYPFIAKQKIYTRKTSSASLW